MGRFDDLMLKGDIVQGMLSLCVRLFIISFILMIAFSVILKRMNAKCRIPGMWFLSLPKLFISVFAILLVFCFDYKEEHLRMFHVYDMTAATFFVGILAIMECIYTLISMIKEFIECNKIKFDFWK